MKAYEPTGLTQMIDTANKSQNTAAHGPAKTDDAETIDFGFRQVRRADKQGLVRGVFDSVAERYDVMNDLMSGGVHRLWKAALIDWMAPQPHQHLVDLAGGTGDVSLRFLRAGGSSAVITDINHAMLSAGRRRRDIAKFNDRTSWCVGNAETLPFANATTDFVTIAFGLRNVTDRQSAISEAHRVLKPGGRFLCLEFSQVKNDLLAAPTMNGLLMHCPPLAAWLPVMERVTAIWPRRFAPFLHPKCWRICLPAPDLHRCVCAAFQQVLPVFIPAGS